MIVQSGNKESKGGRKKGELKGEGRRVQGREKRR